MKPMLATAADALPPGPGWAYEFKWDGVRALFEIGERGPHLHSRLGNEVTIAYPELVAQAIGVEDAMLDGEIVSFVGAAPSFEALQERMQVRAKAEAARLARHAPVTFVAFDLLRLHGVDLTSRPFAERRETLDRWLADHPVWTASPVFDDRDATVKTARANQLEGVVAKRLDSVYRPGLRSPDWRKHRFVRAGDFAVIGWEAPAADDRLSSLLLAVLDDAGDLRFAGKVGSGLTGRSATDLQRRLTPRADSPVAPEPPRSPGRTVRWVEPELVVEVEFTVWTADRRLRHPVLRRVRTDKSVEEAHGDG